MVLEIPSAVTLSARSGLPAQLAESLSDWEAWEAKLALALLTQQQAGSQSRWHEYIRASFHSADTQTDQYRPVMRKYLC